MVMKNSVLCLNVSLVFVAPYASVSFSLASSPLTPRCRGRRDSRAQSCERGDGSIWQAGQDRGPWEQGEAGGVIDNENFSRRSSEA